MTTTESTLSPAAKKLLATLKRKDVDYTTCDAKVVGELRAAGLTAVIFSHTGNWVFATRAGRDAK